MPEDFGRLLEQILRGDNLMGTYCRRTVDVKPAARFDSLLVKTFNGLECLTTNEADSDRFFELIDVLSKRKGSGYYQDSSCCYDEISGYWHVAVGNFAVGSPVDTRAYWHVNA